MICVFLNNNLSGTANGCQIAVDKLEVLSLVKVG